MNEEKSQKDRHTSIELQEVTTTASAEFEQSNKKSESIRHVPLFLSQYSWFMIILCFIAYAFVCPRKHPAQLFKSKNPPHPWNSKEVPRIFSHVTDIHLSASEPFKIVNTRLLLHTMKTYHPDFHLISGDLVDNYGEKNWPKIGRQIREDWDLFKEIVDEELEGEDILDVAGNHDMWAVMSPLSETNFYLDYSHTFNRSNTLTEEDFYCRKVVKDNITFVLINNYKFPTIHPPYIYWAHPSRKMLDIYEKVISSAGNCTVVMHYPTDHNWWITSSKGHTFEEIMQSTNIEHIFSGHFHPSKMITIHHKQGGVEYVGIGAYQYKGFAMVTIDNERLVYHPISLYDTVLPKFFMTNPVPLELLSSHQIFNEESTELRVISYAGKNVTLTASGAVNGTLKFVMKMPNGADLYSIPLRLSKGKYQVTVTGDGCNITRSFMIGDEYKGKDEPMVLLQRGFFIAKSSSIPVYICLFIITFPFNLLPLVSIDDWLTGKSNQSQWVKLIFLSPFILRKRFLMAKSPLRYTIFFFLLYPLALPNHFFKPIHGMYGYSFLCFIYIGGYIMYDEWAVHMTYFYILVIMIPIIIHVTGLEYKNRSLVYLMNKTLMIMLLFGICIVNYRWVGEAVVWPLLFLNPTFVVIPAILQVMLYLYQ